MGANWDTCGSNDGGYAKGGNVVPATPTAHPNTAPIPITPCVPYHAYNPWKPISDATDLKHLGKLLEELGECAAAASRCVIQGIDAAEPTTGKLNRVWLEDELADVAACLAPVINHFRLNSTRINERMAQKIKLFNEWVMWYK